jgi:hypothetical protein
MAGGDVFLIAWIVVAIAWVIVPFILFGTNSRSTDLRIDMKKLKVIAKNQVAMEKTLRELIDVQRRAHNIPDTDKAQDVEDFLKNAGSENEESRF